MKFSLNQKEFIKTLENNYKAIDLNNAFLPLRHFYLETDENELIIKTSDGNFSVKNALKKQSDLKIEEIGKCLIPANIFINIIRKCQGTIEFQKKENLLSIKNNLDVFEINVLDTTEYPAIDFELYGHKINIDPNVLRNAIKNVIFASSQKEEELILNGVNIKLENKKIYVTATDSYRLAREEIEINDDRDLSFDVTIHNKNIKDFIPDYLNEEISLYVNDYKINLQYNDLIIQSKIIEAPYKDVSKIFNFPFDKTLKINYLTILNAIAKAVTIQESTNYLKLDISKEQIVMTSFKDEVNNSKITILSNEFEYEGEPIIITLNYKFLKDAISVFDGLILIHLKSPQQLVSITSEENKNNIQIISPINTH